MSNLPPPPPGSSGSNPQYPPTQPQPGYQQGPPGYRPPAGPGGYGGGQASRGGVPPWAWIIAAVVLIGGGIGAFLLLSGDDDDSESDVSEVLDEDPTADTETADTETDVTETGVPEITAGPAPTIPDSGGTADTGDIFEQLKQQLIDSGLSEEQADCVIEEAVDLGMEGGGQQPEMEDLMGIFETCDIDLTDFQPPGS